ncbi:MAG TPA: hypothetical protein VNS58_28180 [Puia sp.]|nr:hypothetical protein [Puia sp.]
MTKQGNKNTTSGKDPRHKNQPVKGDPGKGAQKAFKKQDLSDADDEPVTESDFDPNSPEKRIQIDDNPEGTKRKIPH